MLIRISICFPVSQIADDGRSGNSLHSKPSSVVQSPAGDSTSIAPLEFPKNESTHHFLHNSTILANLAHLTNKTEVDDMRNYLTNGSRNLDAPEELRKGPGAGSAVLQDQSEWIENGSNTEERKRKMENREFHGSRPPLVHGQLAAVLAGVFLVISLFGYVALLSWRRYLE